MIFAIYIFLIMERTICLQCELSNIIIMVDESGSLSSDTFYNEVKPFLIDITDPSRLKIQFDKVHVGIIEFSTNASIVHDLNGDYNSLVSDINQMSYFQGSTMVFLALSKAEEMFDGNPRSAPEFAILITDGEPTCNGILECNGFTDCETCVIDKANSLKSRGVTVIVIGIQNSYYDHDYLLDMASEDHLYVLTDYGELPTILDSIAEYCPLVSELEWNNTEKHCWSSSETFDFDFTGSYLINALNNFLRIKNELSEQILAYIPCTVHSDNYMRCTAFGSSLSNGDFLGQVTFDETYFSDPFEIHLDMCCYGDRVNDTSVCSFGRGICQSTDHCVCVQSYYRGEKCEWVECNGAWSNDGSVCSSHGECVGYNQCRCYNETKYDGDDCENWNCGVYSNHNLDRVCSGKGECVDYDVCACIPQYTSKYCSATSCGGILSTEIGLVCSGHGNCSDINHCDCDSVEYDGMYCDIWSCFSYSNQEKKQVCSGNGICEDIDSCDCFSGYSGRNCSLYSCGGLFPDDPDVCKKRGKCESANYCLCNAGYEGDGCETWKCFGIEQNRRVQVCAGRGKCESANFCLCKRGYSGDQCGTNSLLRDVVIPVASVGGFLFGIVPFFCMILCCVLVCCCCSLAISIALLCCLSNTIFAQQRKYRKYGKLKNVDVILKEQLLDDDISVARLRINKEMFSIDMDDIEILELIGEGGSQSVVFKASWTDYIVAFKCFKTRYICVSQEDFSEFEKEVEIFGSLQHPSILRFYGCSLKPPRVGILMEYCPNGELLEYIEENELKVPEKILLLKEIISGMEYLHKKKIIHRDLKCENVLISEGGHAKIMDFGLSRMYEKKSQVKTKRIGTDIYMAPELINNETYDGKIDVFAFGILMYVVITENPFPYGKSAFNIQYKVALDPSKRPDTKILLKKVAKEDSMKTSLLTSDGESVNLDSSTAENESRIWMVDLIERCWHHDQDIRPPFAEVRGIFQSVFGDV